jgi:hypothetical protein
VGGINVAKDWHYIQWFDLSGRPTSKPFRFASRCGGFDPKRGRCSDAVCLGTETARRYRPGLGPWLRVQGAEVVWVQLDDVHRLKKLDYNDPIIARSVYHDRWCRWARHVGSVVQLTTLADPFKASTKNRVAATRSQPVHQIVCGGQGPSMESVVSRTRRGPRPIPPKARRWQRSLAGKPEGCYGSVSGVGRVLAL